MTKGGWVEYSSNNSGGSWWLTDEDWRALEAAGWEVQYYANEEDSWADMDGRWLGALASRAKRYGASLEHAVAEWEAITGQTASDEGCYCCGVPHNFTRYTSSGAYLESYDAWEIS